MADIKRKVIININATLATSYQRDIFYKAMEAIIAGMVLFLNNAHSRNKITYKIKNVSDDKE